LHSQDTHELAAELIWLEISRYRNSGTASKFVAQCQGTDWIGLRWGILGPPVGTLGMHFGDNVQWAASGGRPLRFHAGASTRSADLSTCAELFLGAAIGTLGDDPMTKVKYDGDNPLRLANEIDAELAKYGSGSDHRMCKAIHFFEGELRLIAECLRCAEQPPST